MTSSTIEMALPGNQAVVNDAAVDRKKLKSNVLLGVKLLVVSVAAVTMVKAFGLNLVLMLCSAVVLGDLATYIAKENFSLGRRYEFTLLLLNTVCWIVPPLGLFVAGSTFSIASIGIEDCKRAAFYKFVSLASVLNSVSFLALVQIVN